MRFSVILIKAGREILPMSVVLMFTSFPVLMIPLFLVVQEMITRLKCGTISCTGVYLLY